MKVYLSKIREVDMVIIVLIDRNLLLCKWWSLRRGLGRWCEEWTRYKRSLLIGTYFYANGNRYDGSIANDKKNGHGNNNNIIGIFYYYNGDKYEGDWDNDNKHGNGIVFYIFRWI